MPAGSIQTSYVCTLQEPQTAASVAPCADFGGQFYTAVAQTAYILDPGAASAIDAVTGPIDYVDLGGLWTFGFSLTLTLWLVAKNAGAVVNAVRRF